jgi:hypothetical protein
MGHPAFTRIVRDVSALGIASHERVGERPALARTQRMRRDARWFDHCHQHFVDMQQQQRRVGLGDGSLVVGTGSGVLDPHHRTGVQSRSLGRARPVDAHAAVDDQPLRIATGAAELASQPLVEPRAIVGVGDAEGAHVAQST